MVLWAGCVEAGAGGVRDGLTVLGLGVVEELGQAAIRVLVPGRGDEGGRLVISGLKSNRHDRR